MGGKSEYYINPDCVLGILFLTGGRRRIWIFSRKSGKADCGEDV